MLMKAKITALFICIASSTVTQAGNVIINNNAPAPSQPAQPTQPTPQCGGNQNNIYDPRVPPAGSYVIKNSDGSSQDLYTTGEKKPYYVDSNCGQQQTVQPYVYAPGYPPRRR